MKPAKNGLGEVGRQEARAEAPAGGLSGRTIVLGVTGGIAAYKAAELCRLLVKAGAVVRVIMTDAACHFITPLTMQTLSGARVGRELLDLTEESEIGHIRLADAADLVIIAPATADALARLAAGMANDLLSAVVLATAAPVLLAPAMNVNMWSNPLTQANLDRLLQSAGAREPHRFSTVGPDHGALACGWVGQGRLIEPAEVVAAAERILGGGRLLGRKIVVSAGPTVEAIDDVRYLANRSSGKMGFALAQAAAAQGAEVMLIAGPVALPTPPGVTRRIDVESAEEMRRVLLEAAGSADALVMAAAVADFRPAARAPGKLSRRGAGATSPARPTLPLEPNPDILAELGHWRGPRRPFLVGFAAETTGGPELLARAKEKLAEKNCDLIVANDVSAPGTGFGADENEVTLIFADGRVLALPRAPKLALAEQIWMRVADALDEAHGREGRRRADGPVPPPATGAAVPIPAAARGARIASKKQHA